MRCIVCTNTSLMTFKPKQEELAAHVWIYFGFSLIQTGPKVSSQARIFIHTLLLIFGLMLLSKLDLNKRLFVAINKLLNSFWLDNWPLLLAKLVEMNYQTSFACTDPMAGVLSNANMFLCNCSKSQLNIAWVGWCCASGECWLVE